MSFIMLVVFPIGLTVGAVAWTLFRQGGFSGFLFSVVLATLGGLVGFFAAPALMPNAGPSAAGLGAALGAVIAGALETLVRWHSPRSVDDPTTKSVGSEPIEDPPVQNVAAGRRQTEATRPHA